MLCVHEVLARRHHLLGGERPVSVHIPLAELLQNLLLFLVTLGRNLLLNLVELRALARRLHDISPPMWSERTRLGMTGLVTILLSKEET